MQTANLIAAPQENLRLALDTTLVHDLSKQVVKLKMELGPDSGIWTDCGSEGCCQGSSDTSA